MNSPDFSIEYLKSFIAGLQCCYPEASWEYRYNAVEDVYFIRVSPLSFFESERFQSGLIKQNTHSYKSLDAFIFFVPEGFGAHNKWTACDMIIRY